MGIHPNDENSVHESVLANIKFDGTRYEVKFSFKEMHSVLSDHFRNSVAKTRSTPAAFKTRSRSFERVKSSFYGTISKGDD